MDLQKISIIVNLVLCILSFILAAISVITVIVSLKHNGKLIQISNEQIKEMRKEHELSLQPVLVMSNIKFLVEKPRLFYSPPEDKYSIQSRFNMQAEIRNVSSAVALNVICSGIEIAQGESKKMLGESASKRIDILANNSEKLDFMFLEQEEGTVFNGLREDSVQRLPQIKLEVLFMNTSGGAFRMMKKYLIYPKSEELSKIKKWHSIVSSAEADYKEGLRELRQSGAKNENLFDSMKKQINHAGGEEDEIQIECIELDDFVYETISLDEYKRKKQEKDFPVFVGGGKGGCILK